MEAINSSLWQDTYRQAMALIDAHEQDVLALRHALHQDPQLSFAEHRTAEKVAAELRCIGLDPVCGIAGTGIIADLHGTGSGPCKNLLLRADMDALPIEEKNDLPYRSQNPGVMHACGHDVHTANLVGTARVLYALRDRWSGTIRCVFQPAEERGGGGREMLKQGIMDDLSFDASMALHTMATLPPGHISMGWNDVTSFSDRFVIKVYGKQTHSSTPAAGVDAISIAAHIVTGLQGILLKNIDPMKIATYNIGRISGGTAPGIIAGYAEIEGMMRNVRNETRGILRDRMEKIACGVAESYGGRAEFDFIEGYSGVHNDPALTDFVADVIETCKQDWLSGINDDMAARDDVLVRETRPILGAQDYGFYTQRVPSCFYRVATGNASPAHSTGFMVEQPYIKLCTRSMVTLALKYMMG